MSIGPVFFLKSFWLWGLFSIPALYFLGAWSARERKKNFEKFAESPVLSKIAPELDWNLPKKKFRYWILAVGFLILSLARPQWGAFDEVVQSTGLDIMLVVDVSRSMEVEDVVPNRLKKVKHFIRALAERIPGDRLGVIAFAGSAHLTCPLTTDHDYVLDMVENLGPETVSNQGTDIGAALETAARALDRGAEQLSAPDSQVPSTRVVLLISDGEDNEKQIAEGVKKVKTAQVSLYVLGVGTEKGGPIPTRDATGQVFGFKRDRQGQNVVSQFNPASLKKLAVDSGGQFWQVTPGENEIDELLSSLNSLSKGEFSERKVTLREERFQFPLAIALFLLFLELSVPARRILSSVKKTAAVIFILGFLVTAESSYAEEPTLKAYLENQKGIRSFSEDKTNESREHFGNAQVENPLLPEFRFNSANVLLKEENYKDADSSFDSAAREAADSGQFNLAAKSYFNQGVTRFAAKDYDRAAESYLKALESNQKMPDPELDQDIRKNLELLYQAQQSQSQKQEGKEGDEKDDQKKDSSNENQSGKNSSSGDKESKDKKEPKDSDGKEKKQQPKSYQANGKREFKSAKLSPDDAKRVMTELSQKEKELQKKMERMKGRPQGLERDW